MTPLVINRRLLPLGLGLLLLAFVAPLFLAGLRHLDRPERMEEGERIMIPFFGVLAYMALAGAASVRRVTISPEGVRVRQFPFPLGDHATLPRHTITGIYAREIRAQKPARIIYAIGVFAKGKAYDLHEGLPTPQEAEKAAGDVARILNGNPAHPAVGVTQADSRHDGSRRGPLALLWAGLAIAGVIAGAIWELSPRPPHP
jgi:hypothetical protein